MLHGYPQAKFCQESLSYGINSVLYNVGNQIWSQLFIDHQQGTKKILFLCLISEIFYMILDFPSEKAMAPHSSTLAWRIPGTREPGRLQSMGSLGVGHDWATSLSLFTFTHWRRKWQPIPVFSPGKSHGQRSLASYSP